MGREPLGEILSLFCSPLAHHKGRYIRLAYADSPYGPWVIHEPGTLSLEESGFPVGDVPTLLPKNGLQELWQVYPIFLFRDALMASYQAQVVDQKRRQQSGISLATTKVAHIASPDIVIDEENKRFVMFYHGQRDSLSQTTKAAVSMNGVDFLALDFNLPLSYTRSFKYGGWYYLIGSLGITMRSDELLGDYQLRNCSLLGHRSRHLAVRLDEENSKLDIIWTRVGDRPERVLYSSIDLSFDWQDWRATQGITILRPEGNWEGQNLPLYESLRGELSSPANELRDPCIFADKDGQMYLYYSGSGEQTIGGARIIR